MKKGTKKIIFLVLIVLLIMPMASAGFFDWLKKTITGKASSQETDVSITVSGTNQVTIERVNVDTSYTPVENGKRNITAHVVVYDADGVNDINDSATNIKFTKSGDTTRQNTTCLSIGDIDANRANFSCTVSMWYWDGNGTWTVNATGNDLGNLTSKSNASKTFSYTLLKAMVMSPAALTWPSVSPGGVNQTSNNDPTTVNNTGNYNFSINLTGLDLAGETTPTQYIYAENFTSGPDDDCDIFGQNQTYLVNNTAAVLNNTISNRGNLSVGSGSGQEEIYYCIPTIPPALSSQTYSSTKIGSWTIGF